MIRIAENCGLCSGAKRSIDIAEAALREAKASGRPVVLYKELLHNATVMDRLRDMGARRVDDVAEIPADAIVIVRAHGEGEAFHERVRAAGLDCRDATCPNVRKIHELVRDAHAAGKAIVLFGKHGHAEAEGASGWCGDAAAILENEADVDAMPEPEAADILAVCQTTSGAETVERLLARLRARFPAKRIEFKSTICSAPLRIHQPSRELAARCDILFTIGGAKSANTTELRKKCESVGNAECPEQMDSCRLFFDFLKANAEKITPDKRYGFTAGASTPVEEVRKCADLLAFWLYYQETKNRLEEKMNDVNAAFATGHNRILREASEHFAAINGGGKYVRGVLANLGHRIVSGAPSDYPDQLSLAFELFQTAVLIHDDLIDHARTRRGKTTIHHRYREKYEQLVLRPGDAEAVRADRLRLAAETANAMAVCIGDWGLFSTVEMLVEHYGADPRFPKLLRLFNDMIIKTVQGEIIDIVLPFEQRMEISREHGDSLLAAIREIHHFKTSWYTTMGPLVCGMILAGGGEEEMEAMRSFADYLGIAFQIQDDVLGVFGSDEALGKDVGSDVSEYKQTLLYAFTQILSPDLFRELQLYYGKEELTREDNEKVKAVFVRSGAYEAALAEMNRCFEKAREILERSTFLSAENKSVLGGLMHYFSLRDN